jgi:hypothetical protein
MRLARRFGLALLVTFGLGGTALAAVTAAPAAVTVFPGQTSSPITVTLTLTSVGGSGTASLQFAGLPAGVTTVPSPVSYSFAVGSASFPIPVTFEFATTANTPPGTHPIVVTDPTISSPSAVIKPSAGSTVVTLMVQAPGINVTVMPNPLTLAMFGPSQAVTITTTTDPGFATPVSYAFSGLPAFINTGGARTTTAPSFPPVTFPFALGNGATPGTYSGLLVGSEVSGLPLVRVPFSVVVTSPPAPVAIALVPSSIQQGTSGQFTLTGQNFLPGASLSINGGDVSVDSSTVISGTQIQFGATASDTALLGARTLVVTNPDGQHSGPVSLQVVRRPPPMIAVISPSTLPQGATSQLLTVTGGNYLPGATVSVTPSAGIGVGPVTVVSLSQIQFVITIDPNAPPGPRTVVVTNRDGQSSNAGVFQVLPRPPAVLSVTPSALVLGTLHQVLNVIGDNFREGVTAVARSAAITVEGTTRISPTLAKVQVSVRRETSLIGPAMIEMRNPDGGVSVPAGTVLVYPANSLGAPLSVTAVAITFPLPGTFVGPDDAVYPRGVLAIAGTGTVMGTWQLDGVAFDHFVIPAAGGLPVEIHAQLPIPSSFTGSHTLVLAIENPATELRAEVTVIRSERKASGLRLYAPRDGAIVGAEPPVFRWSLVPGAFGYEVEVERGLPELPLFFNVADAEWHPTPPQLAEIGPGVRRWRVRAVFVGGVRGEPTEWRRFAVLPESVHLLLLPPDQGGPEHRFRFRWSGGSPGVLYKVELFPVGGPPAPTFSALTAREEYVLPNALIGGFAFRVRVTAYGPGGRVLGRSETGAGPDSGSVGGMFPDGLMLAAAPPQVQGVTPADGATVAISQPRIAAQWSGGVKANEVLLLVDGTDVTPVSTITSASVTYGCLLPLDSGSHTVRLTLSGQTTSWSFNVSLEGQAQALQAPQTPAGPGEVPTSASAPGKAPSPVRGDWQLGLQGGITFVKEDPKTRPDNILTQFSGQADLSNGALSAKGAGDLAVSHDLQAPNRTVQQSRNWLTNFGAQEGGYQQQLAVGYAAPKFVEGSELMTTGVARGGGEAIFSTPGPVASVYFSPNNQPVGVSAGSFGPKQKITAVALETPASLQGVQIRAIGLKTEDEPGFNSAGGEGKLYGIFGRIGASPAFGLLFEAARGKFTPNPGSTETEREGNAYRLGLIGTRGTFSYVFNLRRTEANFVNPANRGFTVGGVADREGADLMLTKGFGLTTVSVQLRHIRGGGTSGSVSPSARESGAVVQLNTAFSPKVMFQLGGNVTTNTGDADTVHQLPKTDNRMWGTNASLSEIVGAINLSQALTYQSVANAVMPDADMTTKGGTFTAGGQIVPPFGLFGTAAFTRTQGSATVGTNDQTLLSIQPNWTILALKLSVQPQVAFNKSQSSLTDTATTTWQYQVAVTWTPPAIGSYASLQFTGAWNRTQITGQTAPGFQRRLGLVVNIQWGGSSASSGAGAMSQPMPEPMVAPPGAPTGTPSAMNLLPQTVRR